MKKVIFVIFLIVIVFIVVLATTAVIVSFKTIRPTTTAISKGLAQNFSKIVRIPSGVPPALTFESTTYSWEMETVQKEVTGVNFSYTTGFLKNDDEIQATLELPPNGDPSIFNKVLPALITDNQSLESAQDPKKANLKANLKAGYDSILLSTTPKSNQTIKITWKFKKSTIGDNLKKNYDILSKYPDPLLKTLYAIPSFIIDLFKS